MGVAEWIFSILILLGDYIIKVNMIKTWKKLEAFMSDKIISTYFKWARLLRDDRHSAPFFYHQLYCNH